MSSTHTRSLFFRWLIEIVVFTSEHKKLSHLEFGSRKSSSSGIWKIKAKKKKKVELGALRGAKNSKLAASEKKREKKSKVESDWNAQQLSSA